MLSFHRQLALIHLVMIVVIIACVAFAGWWELSRLVSGQFDAALVALAETEVDMLADSKGQLVRVHEAPAETTPPSLMRLGRLVQIIDAKGKVLARSGNLGVAQLPAPPTLLAQLAVGDTVFETLQHFYEEPLRIVSVPTVVNGKMLAVQVACSLDDVNHILESAKIPFAILAVTLLAAVGTTGIVLTGRMFRAINCVVDQAHSIGEASLHERLPHPGTTDEIGHLVDTLNAMLGRIERAFDIQRCFTIDASHELRSPLSRLRAEIEISLRRERENGEYIATLRACLDEVERLTLVVEKLLMLARVDVDQEHDPIEEVSLNALAEEATRRLAPLARERHIQLIVEGEIPVSTSVAHRPTGLVLNNLLDNALRFSPQGSEVRVRVAVVQGRAMISVTDQGASIADEDIPHVFDRFYRGAGACAGAVEGLRTGLALTQAILRVYGGQVEVANAPAGGVVSIVYLPLVAA